MRAFLEIFDFPCYSPWCVPQLRGDQGIPLKGQNECLYPYMYNQLLIWTIVRDRVYIILSPMVPAHSYLEQSYTDDAVGLVHGT